MRYQTYVHERNWGARVTEFEYRGYSMVALENRFLRVVVAAGKGTDIVEFIYKPLDVDFMWRSYTGLRDPGISTPRLPTPTVVSSTFIRAGGRSCCRTAAWIAYTRVTLWACTGKSAWRRGNIT